MPPSRPILSPPTALDLAIGEPVFNVRTLARDRRHRILAYVDCLYRPDRYEAHAAIEIGDRRRDDAAGKGGTETPLMASIPRSRRSRSSPTRDTALASRRFDKGVARYYRLYELLSAALQDGTIPPESALPSEPQLCARHGISRTTVRRALDRLEREGRIVRRRGSGTYARPQRAPAAAVCRAACPVRNTGSGTNPAPPRRRCVSIRRRSRRPCARSRSKSARRRTSSSGFYPSHGEPLSLTAAYLPEPIGRRLQRPIRGRASLITMLARLETTGRRRQILGGSGSGRCRCRARAPSAAGLGSRQSPRGSDR